MNAAKKMTRAVSVEVAQKKKQRKTKKRREEVSNKAPLHLKKEREVTPTARNSISNSPGRPQKEHDAQPGGSLNKKK